MFTMFNFACFKRTFYVVTLMFILSQSAYSQPKPGGGGGTSNTSGNGGMWTTLTSGVKTGAAGAGAVINVIFGIMVIILVVLAASSYLGDGNKLKSYVIGIVVMGILWAVANALLASIGTP